MAEQKQRQKAAPARTEEVVDDAPAKTERGEKLNGPAVFAEIRKMSRSRRESAKGTR